MLQKWRFFDFISLVVSKFRHGGPFKLVVKGQNSSVILTNIMLGEVWICAGQSNMQFNLTKSIKGQKALAEADHPKIRLFTVPPNISLKPKKRCGGKWEICKPNSNAVRLFSAVGFYFGREIHEKVKVPVGLIDNSWGGTKAEAWVDKETLNSDSVFIPILERAKQSLKKDESNNQIDKNFPSALYNGMVNPLIRFPIRGVIWYQGEGNGDRGYQYRKLFPALIKCWRKNWGQGNFPFYFVQLSSWKHPNNFHPELWAELREAQFQTLHLPNTGMAVTIDIGNPNDIHPKNKYDVGHRLALWARAETYNEKGLVYSGPLYERVKKSGNAIRVYFNHRGSGLTFKGDELGGFMIAGKEKKFIQAQACIENDYVKIWSDDINEPVAVRYGWCEYPENANLFNKQGLPASPFRTDDWPGISYDRR